VQLVKVDNNGTILWEKQYGYNYWELPIGGLLSDDAGFLICGYRENGISEDRAILLIRTNSLGNELGGKTYWSDNNDYGAYIVKNLEGGYTGKVLME